jgi:hypothetical protein
MPKAKTKVSVKTQEKRLRERCANRLDELIEFLPELKLRDLKTLFATLSEMTEAYEDFLGRK